LQAKILELCIANAQFEEAHQALIGALMILIAMNSPSEQAAVSLISKVARLMRKQARSAYQQVRADLDLVPAMGESDPKLDRRLTAQAASYRELWLEIHPGKWISEAQAEELLLQALHATGVEIYRGADGVWHERGHDDSD
jgi:hypothetical protein